MSRSAGRTGFASAARMGRQQQWACTGQLGQNHPPPTLPGGDRAAINALHRVDLVRMSNDARTRAYVIRQLANGRTKRDVVRLRKRAIAR